MSGSLFERPALLRLAEALRRRTAGGSPALDPVDRIAWCLDLTDLDPAEREALISESTGRKEGLEGTTVLLGLLCRSAVVLDEEFSAIGIATDELTGAWSQELSDLLQQEVNRSIASDYRRASALTELKSRFLALSHTGSNRTRVRRASPPPSATPGAPEQRRESAPAPTSTHRQRERATPAWREWPWARIARSGAAGLFTVIALLALVDTLVWGKGRVGGAELAQLSRYLSHGKRSETGTGFVGTLDDSWFELEPARKEQAANALVAALRERGVREIMVYDDDQRLCIQALGEQPARIIR